MLETSDELGSQSQGKAYQHWTGCYIQSDYSHIPVSVTGPFHELLQFFPILPRNREDNIWDRVIPTKPLDDLFQVPWHSPVWCWSHLSFSNVQQLTKAELTAKDRTLEGHGREVEPGDDLQLLLIHYRRGSRGGSLWAISSEEGFCNPVGVSHLRW